MTDELESNAGASAETRREEPFTPQAQRRLGGDDRGIAAVEFALILPLMLMIFLGLVELSRGMRTAQKLDLVTHTLSDLTAQQLTGGTENKDQAGLNGTDFAAIFSAASTIMAPQSTTNLKMTISEVEITQTPAPPTPPTSWTAKTRWSITYNGGTLRDNPLLPAEDAAPVSATTMPTSYTAEVSGVKPTTGSIIVADVVYNYSPGVNFEFFKWSSPPTWTMSRTSYAPVRNTYVPSHIQYNVTAYPTNMSGVCRASGGACP